MPGLNIKESDILERTEKLLEKDNNWEAHVAQQVPLLTSISPYPDNNQTRPLEQVEPKTEDDMDVRDFSKRLSNDKRPNLHESPGSCFKISFPHQAAHTTWQ